MISQRVGVAALRRGKKEDDFSPPPPPFRVAAASFELPAPCADTTLLPQAL